MEEQEEGARLAINPEKRNPADFAVWKKAEAGHILRWPSPWGWGYPGWHLECSVMATKYLGQPFDIHGGGLENMFPHNECEIAQIEAATGKQFCNYWLLNNMVMVNGVKMGKSLGNYTTIKDALSRHEPMTLRFFILSSHYRSTTDFAMRRWRRPAVAWNGCTAPSGSCASGCAPQPARWWTGTGRPGSTATGPVSWRRWTTTLTRRRPSQCCSIWAAR